MPSMFRKTSVSPIRFHTSASIQKRLATHSSAQPIPKRTKNDAAASASLSEKPVENRSKPYATTLQLFVDDRSTRVDVFCRQLRRGAIYRHVFVDVIHC